jgi:hypothetical protein
MRLSRREAHCRVKDRRFWEEMGLVDNLVGGMRKRLERVRGIEKGVENLRKRKLLYCFCLAQISVSSLRTNAPFSVPVPVFSLWRSSQKVLASMSRLDFIQTLYVKYVWR